MVPFRSVITRLALSMERVHQLGVAHLNLNVAVCLETNVDGYSFILMFTSWVLCHRT